MADEQDSGPKVDPTATPKRYDFDPSDIKMPDDSKRKRKGLLSKVTDKRSSKRSSD